MVYRNIRILAAKRGTTVNRIEKDLHISNGRLAKWDRSSPTVATAKRVADYLGVTLDELLREDEDAETPTDN